MTQKLENEQIYFIIYGDFIPHPEKKWTVLLWDCFRETGNGTGWNVHLWVHLVPIDFLMGHGIPQTVEVTLFRGSMKEMHISGRKRAENGKYYFALKEAIKHDGFETLSSCCQHFSSPLGWTVWWSCPEGHNLFSFSTEKKTTGGQGMKQHLWTCCQAVLPSEGEHTLLSFTSAVEKISWLILLWNWGMRGDNWKFPRNRRSRGRRWVQGKLPSICSKLSHKGKY